MNFENDLTEEDCSTGEVGDIGDSSIHNDRRIGHFELTDLCGGTRTLIARAYDSKQDREVVIKEIPVRDHFNGEDRERFSRLANALAQITHPNVVTSFGAIEGVDRPFLVMEFVEGRSLADVTCHEDAIPGSKALRWAREIASGLHSIHQAGLIHQDLKPSNVLIESPTSIAKIVDFGLAKLQTDSFANRTGQPAGTPLPMSPEQAMSSSVDLRSDLFSLGSLLYKLYTGRNPFMAETALATIQRVIHSDPIPAQELNSTIPDWLALIVAQLLEKNPDDRIQSASEVADQIEARIGSEDLTNFLITRE